MPPLFRAMMTDASGSHEAIHELCMTIDVEVLHDG